MRDVLAAANSADAAVAGRHRAGPQECIHGVVHIDEVANLRALTEDLILPSLEGKPDKPADEPLAAVANELPRAINVREPQPARATPLHIVIDEVVVLAGRLVDAVDVRWPNEVCFVHRQPVGPAV